MIKRPINAAERLEGRWIPKHDLAVRPKDKRLTAVVYIDTPHLVAVGYAGNAMNPTFNLTFRSMDNMSDHVRMFFRGLALSVDAKAERAAERNGAHSIKVDDIFYTSGGYDMTQVSFYQVSALSGKTMIWLRPIKDRRVMGEDGNGKATAIKDGFVPDKKPFRCKVDPRRNEVKIGYTYATLWDGTPRGYSTDG